MDNSTMIANIINDSFRCIVIRRKLSSQSLSTIEEYDFDTDYNTNVAQAECFIDETGDISTGLFTRNNPPQWEDFLTYGSITPVCKDLVNKSEVGNYLTLGNAPQNAQSGQTNYYFDCQPLAVANLPQYKSLNIDIKSDGYVWAYDIWVTPFKLFTFGIWGNNTSFSLRWLGNDPLISPRFIDGSSLSEPTIEASFSMLKGALQFDDVILLPIPHTETTHYYPNLSSLSILPAEMDSEIGLNINYYYNTPNTNNRYGYNCAVSNTYKDFTTIPGGTYEDDVNYAGILRKYYGENESVTGENEEPHFEDDECILVYREADIHDMMSHFGVSGDPSSVNNNSLINTFFRYMDYSWLSHSYVSNPRFLKEYKNNNFEEYNESVSTYIDSNGKINDSAWDNVTFKIPKTQYNIPTPNVMPTPTSSFGNTFEFYKTDPYEFDHYETSDFAVGWIGNINEAGRVEVTYHPYGANNYAGELTDTFDDEFNNTWSFTNQWIEQMIKIKIPKDDKIRYYTFYADRKSKNASHTLVVYFNKYMNENSVNNVDRFTASPIITAVIMNGFYGDNDTYHANQTVGGGYRLVRDNTWDFIYPTNVGTAPIIQLDNSVQKNAYFGDTDTDIALYVAKLEQSWYTFGEGNTKYFNAIGVYTPRIEYNIPGGYTKYTQYPSFMTLTPQGALSENQQISDPMQKDSTGNIVRPNGDSNSGDGGSSNNPEHKGTHRTHIETTKKVPHNSTNVSATGLVTSYVVDANNISKLASDLFSNNVFQQLENGVNKPIDCVLRLCQSRVSPRTESNTKVIKLGVCNTSASGYKVTKDMFFVDCGKVKIERINGDYTDCNERIQIYLPFIGFKDLDGNLLQNTTVQLEYVFNFTNGKCMAHLSWTPNANNLTLKEFQGKIVYYGSWCGDFITTVPVGTSSNIGLLSAITATGVGLATGNVTFGLANAVGTGVANAIPTMSHAGEFGANTSVMSDYMTPYIHKYSLRHSRPDDEKDKNGKCTYETAHSGYLTGESSYKSLTIANMHGFNRIKNFKFHDEPNNITKDEINKIKSILDNGFWKN